MGGKPIRYKWEHCPNPDVATLHLDRDPPRFTGDEIVFASEEAAALSHDLYAIDGVSRATSGVLCRYQISITKGSCFDWNVIKPRVLSVVEGFFGARAEPVESEKGGA